MLQRESRETQFMSCPVNELDLDDYGLSAFLHGF